ncbi:MAG: hypothetical protein IJ009_07735 [Clostridia bacterium]|nr:hypothetical protein [Clostridia bacterium]
MFYLLLLALLLVYVILQGRLVAKRMEAQNERLTDLEDTVGLMIQAKTDASAADAQTDSE